MSQTESFQQCIIGLFQTIERSKNNKDVATDLSKLAQALEIELKDMQKGETSEYHYLIVKAFKQCIAKVKFGKNSKYYRDYLIELLDYFKKNIPPTKNKVEQLTAAEAPQEVLEEIKVIHDKLYNAYYKYQVVTLNSISHILKFYHDLKQPGLWQKFYRGYFYKGELESSNMFYRMFAYFAKGGDYRASIKRNQALITLIDSLAQRSPDFTKQLYIKMKVGNYTLEKVTEEILAEFKNIQDSYLARLKLEDQKIIDYLTEFYKKQFFNPETAKKYIESVYHKIINGEELSLQEEGIVPLKLIYDIQRIKGQVNAYRDYIAKYQLTKLKEEINDALEILGMSYKSLCEVPGKSQLITTCQQSETDAEVYYQRRAQVERRKRSTNRLVSIIGMIFLGAGEGFVAALGILPLVTLTSPLGIIILATVWLTGAISNYALTVQDSEDTLNKIRLGTLYYDENNKKISNTRKSVLQAFGIFSIITGIGYGVLSYTSVITVFIQPLFSSHLALLIIGYSLFAIPPICTAIGLGCIFYVTVSDFIINFEARMKGIQNYFHHAFYAPVSQMTWWEIAGLVPRYLLEIIKLSIGIGVVVFITWATFGVMYRASLNILGNIVYSDLKLKLYAGIIGGITTAINSFFSTEKVMRLFQPLTVQGIVNFLAKTIYIASGLGILMSFIISFCNNKFASNVSILKSLDTLINTEIRGNTFSGVDNIPGEQHDNKPVSENDVVSFVVKTIYTFSIVLPVAVFVYSLFTKKEESGYKKIDAWLGTAKPATLANETQQVNQSTYAALVGSSLFNSGGQGSLMGQFGIEPVTPMNALGAFSTFVASFGPIIQAIKSLTAGSDVTVAKGKDTVENNECETEEEPLLSCQMGRTSSF